MQQRCPSPVPHRYQEVQSRKTGTTSSPARSGRYNSPKVSLWEWWVANNDSGAWNTTVLTVPEFQPGCAMSVSGAKFLWNSRKQGPRTDSFHPNPTRFTVSIGTRCVSILKSYVPPIVGRHQDHRFCDADARFRRRDLIRESALPLPKLKSLPGDPPRYLSYCDKGRYQ